MTSKGTKTSSKSGPLRKPEKRRAGGVRISHGVRVWLMLLGLLLATLAAYEPAWHGSLLWDDDHHITRSDLRSVEGLRNIWFTLGATQQYYPVLHSAFWLQHKLWDDDTLGYHLTSLVFHALSAFFLALILTRLAVPGALLAAAIFALHPVQVESVAWISELKNTLSGVFYLGAAWAYLRFDEAREKRFYVLAMALFVLALLSKTVTATLPASLIVVFWWRRGRLSGRRDWLPLIPFFSLGTAAGLFTVWVEQTLIGARGAAYQFSLIERVLIAGRAIWFYLGKLIWPSGLIFIYPRWKVSQNVRWQYIYPVGVILLLLVLWLLRKRSRSPLATALLFCGALFPALGFFNLFPFRFSFVADHFQYLAAIPVIALFSAGAASLVNRLKLLRMPATAPMLVLMTTLAFLTWSQSHLYADAETLYRATLTRNPACWMAHNNLGEALLGRSRVEEAIVEFKEALKANPDIAQAHGNLGTALLRMGRVEEAMAECREALRIDPTLPKPHLNLGNVLQSMGRPEEALTQYRESIRLNPNIAEAHNNMGNLLLRMNRLEEAMAECKEALQIDPDLAEAYHNLADVLQTMGRLEEAITQYREALKRDPGSAICYNNIGLALMGLGRQEEALAHFKAASELDPGLIAAHYNLGEALRGLGRYEEAIAQYKEVLLREPDSPDALNSVGLALMASGRIEEALAHFEEALRVKPGFADARTNLAKATSMLKAGNGTNRR